jgi:peroxiredoxin
MKNNKTIIAVFFVLAGLTGVFLLSQPSILESAPKALFKTINGETIALDELKGKAALIVFWATDCPVCLEEIPDLIKLNQAYAPDKLKIIAVAMYYDPPNNVVEFAAAQHLPYPVAIDPAAENALAFGNVQYTPTYFLIDGNGNIALHKIGRIDFAVLEERLKLI